MMKSSNKVSLKARVAHNPRVKRAKSLVQLRRCVEEVLLYLETELQNEAQEVQDEVQEVQDEVQEVQEVQDEAQEVQDETESESEYAPVRGSVARAKTCALPGSATLPLALQQYYDINFPGWKQ